MLLALGRDREVNHHDAVLLDNADQQNDADQRDKAEVVAEQHQCRKSPDARRRQRRQDRDRMDVALVENTEDQVNYDERGEDQQRYRAERLLERLRCSLKAAVEGARRAELAHGVMYGGRGIAERYILREIEADGD